MKRDDGLDDDCDIKNTLPAVLGGFILSNSRPIMNKIYPRNKQVLSIEHISHRY